MVGGLWEAETQVDEQQYDQEVNRAMQGQTQKINEPQTRVSLLADNIFLNLEQLLNAPNKRCNSCAFYVLTTFTKKTHFSTATNVILHIQ